jgi:hypothetical protein
MPSRRERDLCDRIESLAETLAEFLEARSCRFEAWSWAMPDYEHSSNDVGGDLVFDEGDAVSQLQLALLQPLEAQQVWRRRLMQGIDRGIEIAVLLLQPCELGFEFALIFVGHGLR